MNEKKGLFSELAKSGFVRSVFTRVLAIFIIVAMIIAATAFYSFTGEIRKSVLSDRQKRLAAVEETISERMKEITSIAYNIGTDPVFYLEPVDDVITSGREMSKMLERYLVGNNFIENLAFLRVSEPDTIYVSTGERSLSEFFITTFGMDEASAKAVISNIHGSNKMEIRISGSGDNSYFAYSYPLPELAAKPLAHVLMMIPTREVQPLLEALLINSNGEVAVFNADGSMIYSAGTHDEELDFTEYVKSGAPEEEYKCPSGERYVLQKIVSETNSWIYVCATRHSDTLSGLANKQVEFIVFVLLTLVAAIVIMLASIITQYKPIGKPYNPDTLYKVLSDVLG